MPIFQKWTAQRASRKGPMEMKYTIESEREIEQLLLPETELEQQLLQQPDFREGLMWGKPCMGHPEGKVVLHVREVLDNIDQLQQPADVRQQLRLIAYAHDTFKYKEVKGFPRDWSKHHAVFARQFMETYTNDEAVLRVIELHDEAFYSWRAIHVHHRNRAGQRRLQQLLDRLEDHLPLFHLFFSCDTRTGDKNQAPLSWFEDHLAAIRSRPV